MRPSLLQILGHFQWCMDTSMDSDDAEDAVLPAIEMLKPETRALLTAHIATASIEPMAPGSVWAQATVNVDEVAVWQAMRLPATMVTICDYLDALYFLQCHPPVPLTEVPAPVLLALPQEVREALDEVWTCISLVWEWE